MKSRKLTLADVLIAVAVIVIAMIMLLPALSRPTTTDWRAVCGANLSALYKGLLIYAKDNNDDFPRAGGRRSYWGPTEHWDEPFDPNTYKRKPSSATIGASLYLLIKYDDIKPEMFICGGDTGAKVFKLRDYKKNKLSKQDLKLAWDFGPTNAKTGSPPARHYSYAYDMPYAPKDFGAVYAPRARWLPGEPIMADRSPYFVLKHDDPKNPAKPVYEFTGGKDKGKEQWGNSTNHNRQGQNVLFYDGHVAWKTVPYCGHNNDNIYTMAEQAGNPAAGSLPKGLFDKDAGRQNENDAVLLNEGLFQGTVAPK